MRDNFRAIRVRLARINAYVAENITGMSIIQLFNREQRNYKQFDVLNRDYLQQTIRSLFYFILFSAVTSFFSSLAVALVIWYGGGRILAGVLTVPTLAVIWRLSNDRATVPTPNTRWENFCLGAATVISTTATGTYLWHLLHR